MGAAASKGEDGSGRGEICMYFSPDPNPGSRKSSGETLLEAFTPLHPVPNGIRTIKATGRNIFQLKLTLAV